MWLKGASRGVQQRMPRFVHNVHAVRTTCHQQLTEYVHVRVSQVGQQMQYCVAFLVSLLTIRPLRQYQITGKVQSLTNPDSTGPARPD